MPLHEIDHTIPLFKLQRDEIAQTVTAHPHTQICNPGLYVNIRFMGASNQHNYEAGKEVALRLNYMISSIP